MSNSKTHTYTSRADGGEPKETRRRRMKALKELKRSLTFEEVAELSKLMREFGNEKY